MADAFAEFFAIDPAEGPIGRANRQQAGNAKRDELAAERRHRTAENDQIRRI